MKIVFLGAPGAGKGTHAKFISKKLNIPHISTGDIFREAIEQKTDLGLLAQSLINDGNFVPDDITNELVKERISQPDCKNGFILDGYPRNLNQGKMFSQVTDVDLVIYFNLSLDMALNRLLNRRVCSRCGEIYNLTNYAKVECQKCGGELITRRDDNKDVILKRFEVYKEVTYPLVEYYYQLNILKEVEIEESFEKNNESILKIIGEFHDKH